MKLSRRVVPIVCLFVAFATWNGHSQVRQLQPNPFDPFQPFQPFPLQPLGEPTLKSKQKLDLRKGDRIVFMGDTFAERAGLFGYFETLLQARFPELKLTFRNLGYPGDTPASLLADLKGTMEYNHESNRALNFGAMTKHLKDVKADVIFLCVGMNDSFKGDAGLAEFEQSLQKLLVTYRNEKFNGKTAPRIVLVGPIAHEYAGGDFPDPKEHNKHLVKYTQEMRKVAEQNQHPFVEMFTPMQKLMEEQRMTINGIHLNQAGYWAAAHFLMDQLNLTLPRWSVSLKTPTSIPFAEKTLPSPPYPSDPPSPPLGKRGNGGVPSSLLRYFPYVVDANLPNQKGELALVVDKEICLRGTGQDFMMGPFLFNSPMQNAAEKLRLAIVEQNQEWFYKWRAVNGEYIYGRRAAPFGVKNFPGEMAQMEKTINEMDARIHKLNTPAKKYVAFVQTKQTVEKLKLGEIKRFTQTVEPPPVEKVYDQKPGFIGRLVDTAADLDAALKSFKLQDGYEINLFASEKDFPLHNPLAMAWDPKGRLWVTTMPSYPQYLPGSPPNDKILILEDTKGTGKADKCTVFADKLYLPTGLELGNGGVYVAAQPNIMFLKDTNGDDVADTREVILHGFGTGDSHHAVHTFTWSPEGALHFNEGIFHRANVETPFGLLRQRDAAIYRFEPRRHKLETYVSYHFANPWGQVYDRWGFNFIADASGGANYNALPMTGHVEFPRQHPGMRVFTSIVRPTCGCELVSSRHFPPEAQGNFLVPNNIGFQGVKQHKVIAEGSGFTSKETEPLLFSTDRNFRPVDIKFGPDGALYIVDWYNPLIGHMQHSIRDPGRDHIHGRIWRITAKNRALVTPVKIAGEPIAELLDLLKEPEDRTRYRVRMELRERDRFDVQKALEKWIPKLKEDDAEYEHHLLEALWVYQGVNQMNEELLARLLHAKDYRARAAATRALRYLPEAQGQPSLGLERVYKHLEGQINDVHPRVRLEAVVALSFFKDSRAVQIAVQAAEHPMDYYLEYALKETITTLQPYWMHVLKSGKSLNLRPKGATYLLASVATSELAKMPPSEAIFLAILFREGVPLQMRHEALENLARHRKSAYLPELFAQIDRLDDAKHVPSSHVLHDLTQLLLARDAKELKAHRESLENLALGAHHPLVRQTGFVALMTADGTVDRVWMEATKNLRSTHDLVAAVPMLPSVKLRAELYPKIYALLNGLPPQLEGQVKDRAQADQIRLAAIEALPSIPGKDAETFTALARFVKEGRDRDAAVKSLRRIAKKSWPQSEAKPLAESLLKHVQSLGVTARSEPPGLDALQLGTDLAAFVPGKEGEALQTAYSKLGVQVILIRTIPHNMVFDVAEFTVEAGRTAVIMLENNDIMPHNLLIIEPGSLATVGQLAEKMASDPDAFKKGFVPKHKAVLHASRLLQPRESERITFTAPKAPGKYLFVCTFPGHWTVMNGIMNVVPDLNAVAASDRIKYLENKKWTVTELAGDLDKMNHGRNFARGKELFTLRSCNQCHKIGNDGGMLGPDLNELPKKLATGKFSKADLLREVIEPAAAIEKKYQLVVFELNNGQVIQGVIVHEDGNVIRVAKNQVEPPIEIKRGIVAARAVVDKVSIMPNGLMDRLTREDVFDLLAYIAAGGDERAPAFRRKD
jgi:putative heme-binding domain-containing protein